MAPPLPLQIATVCINAYVIFSTCKTWNLTAALFMTICLSKVCIILYNKEGTFLRQYLLILLGACDFGIATAYPNTVNDDKVIIVALAMEGAMFLGDGLLRKRQAKGVKGKKT